jgi:type I restriction enzyme S subunit
MNIEGEWKQTRIKELGKVISGGTPPTGDVDNWNGDISWITPSEITSLKTKYIYGNTHRKVTEKGLRSSSAVMIPSGSLILSSRATIGDCGINTVPISTNQGFKNIIPNEKIVVDFLYYFIKSNKKKLLRLSCGSTFLELSRKDLEKVIILLPPPEEQKSIVSVIEKWDKYIEILDQKIQIKKDIKRYFMQVLLEGKLRIPGDVDEWKSLKLKDIGLCIRGVSYKPKEDLLTSTGSNAYTLLRSTNVQDGKLILEDIQIVRSEKVKDEQILKPGDIVICMANGSKRLVGKSTQFNMRSDRYTVGAFMGIFRIKDKSYINYVRQFFNTDRYRYYISNLLSGTSINNLKSSDIESIPFKVPTSSAKRETISSILSKSDEEITMLEKQRDIIEEQRKYLLNNLVTGEIRLPKFRKSK